MCYSIRHRGPDDWGVWTDDDSGIALGFRRLSIIDLSEAGHQPMCSPSGRYVILFNGEVYNHEELRKELLAKGFTFRGHSDTEVILASFETWGIEAATRRFVGMFAMGVWDGAEKKLVLIRDRLGIKPLFVARDSNRILFASEIKAILAADLEDRSIDLEALTAYLRYLYVPAPRSIFQSVRKLLPGHLLEIVDPTSPLPEPRPWWSVEEVARAGVARRTVRSDREIVDEAEALLLEATRTRTYADVPVGAFLSGGIDSSTVVALMASVSERPVKTFTIAFDREEFNEAHHAAEVARVLGTDHTEVLLGGRDALELVPRIPEIFDEPLADPSQLPTFLVSQIARRDVTVALSGDGGDEVFAGYNRYTHGVPMVERASAVPVPARRMAAGVLATISPGSWDRLAERVSGALPEGLRHRLPGEKVHKLARLLEQPDRTAMYRSFLSVWPDPASFVSGGGEPTGALERVFGADSSLDLLDRMMLSDQLEYLPDDLLAKVDRASMAVSLEVRVPILDHRVVEFAWALPASAKVRDRTGKWLLREVLHRHLPRELVERPKMGFSVPVDGWLRGELKEWAGDLLSPAAIARDGILSAPAVERAWSDFQAGRTADGLGLWALVVFQAWAHRWT